MCVTSHRAHVTVTDLEDLQTLMRVNIQENQALISGSITAKVLEWFVLKFLFLDLIKVKYPNYMLKYCKMQMLIASLILS